VAVRVLVGRVQLERTVVNGGGVRIDRRDAKQWDQKIDRTVKLLTEETGAACDLPRICELPGQLTENRIVRELIVA
jgi:hypothetical protein